MAPARTRTTDALSAAGDAELGSAAQRERRKRILDATLALASKGGYDAVQMRTVAERADVAPPDRPTAERAKNDAMRDSPYGPNGSLATTVEEM